MNRKTQLETTISHLEVHKDAINDTLDLLNDQARQAIQLETKAVNRNLQNALDVLQTTSNNLTR